MGLFMAALATSAAKSTERPLQGGDNLLARGAAGKLHLALTTSSRTRWSRMTFGGVESK